MKGNFVLIMALIVGEGYGLQTPPGESPCGSLGGEVFDSSGNAKADIEVLINKSNAVVRAERTGEDGKFKSQGLALGEYRVMVRLSAGDSSGLRFGSASSSRRVVIRSCQDTPHLLFRIPGTGSISGRALTTDRVPVAGATIEVHTLIDSLRRNRLWRRGLPTAKTAADGSFTIRDLTEGSYFVRAVPPEERPAPQETAQDSKSSTTNTLLPALYPEAESPDTAWRVQVRAGLEVQGVDIRLRVARSRELVVRLEGASTGNAAERTKIFALPDRGREVAPFELILARRIGPDRYRLTGLSDDPYVIYAYRYPSSGAGGESGTIPFRFKSEDTTREVVVPLMPDRELQGRLEWDEPRAKTDASMPSKLTMMLAPQVAPSHIERPLYAELDLKEGLLRFERVPEGRYLLIPGGDAGAIAITSAVCQETPNQPWWIAREACGSLILKATTRRSTIAGKVLKEDGKPISNALVAACVPESAVSARTMRDCSVTDADQEGSYSLTVAPGSYTLMAFLNLDATQEMPGAVLRKLAVASQDVELRPNDARTLNLKR